MKKKNNQFPHLPEEEINKLVEELTDPNLVPLSHTEEELLLRILEKKLAKGLIKTEFKNGKFLLWTKNERGGFNTEIRIYDENDKK